MQRPYGTGQLYENSGSYYGRWRTPDGRRLNRRLSSVRAPGDSDGITRAQAERLHILAPGLIGRPAGDPDLRFVAMMCACAAGVLAGDLPGPYTDALAEEWARAALADDLPSVSTTG